jgi:hypothetical protein
VETPVPAEYMNGKELDEADLSVLQFILADAALDNRRGAPFAINVDDMKNTSQST